MTLYVEFTFPVPCTVTRLLQFEPPNTQNVIKFRRMLQHASSYMFRAVLFHHQGAHNCTVQLLNIFLHVAKMPKTPKYICSGLSCTLKIVTEAAGVLCYMFSGRTPSTAYLYNTVRSDRQLCYMHKILGNCAVQLCAACWCSSECRNM
jgi:hypothetical protein